MFSHKHYVPVLKGKRAEFPAIGKLKSHESITPLIESIPTANADDVPRQMGACGWPDGKPYFLDLLYFDDEYAQEIEEPLAPVVEALTAAKERSQAVIPVTGTGRSPSYQSAIRKFSKESHGVGIRLVSDDFEDVGELSETVISLTEFLEIQPASCDVLIDLGSVAGQPTGTLKQILKADLTMLPKASEWRTLTVICGGFPLSLATLKRGEWNAIPRVDWLCWKSLVTTLPEGSRLPSFGDYGIAHPGLPPTGRATILAQLRYSTGDSYLIWKGDNAIKKGFTQFISICKNLVSSPEFKGASFSEGDAEIEEKATSGGSPGNAETWRRIGTNHHIEMVLSQIANLP